MEQPFGQVQVKGLDDDSGKSVEAQDLTKGDGILSDSSMESDNEESMRSHDHTDVHLQLAMDESNSVIPDLQQAVGESNVTVTLDPNLAKSIPEAFQMNDKVTCLTYNVR